jgi:DNA segregation ATPase FtsK/SpoIIIE-like protein
MPSALSVVRPAVAAVALLAAVALTAVVLYLYWPAGVAVGLAVGAAAVLAVGARMQVTERLQPADEDLEAQLGILREPEPVAVEAVRSESAVAQPVAAAPPTPAVVEAVPALHVQPDVLYFTSDEDPDAAEPRVVVGDDLVPSDLEGLKEQLGADYRDFARAAQLVVSTQYASAARLQRDLDLPYSRARRLLSDLEQRHVVGPATGSLPRQVLLPKERLPEVEALLAEV